MSNEDKRADEIVEEIMKSIYDDLDNMEKEKKNIGRMRRRAGRI